MNWAEKAVLNNPVRRALQRHYEAPLLTRLGADVGGAHVLEVGCGEGAGAQTLLTRLGASRVTAIDLDPAQVERAERRLRGEDRAEVRLGDVTALPLADASVDAVARVVKLERQGLVVGGRHTQRFFGDFVLGVAVRT
ncbi:MAG: class I SAM-dependent methyltransferase [Actinomycetota bacterium]|nr:class I SAM-dependent methyltransferase [Actinomycetota bacterium]